MGLFDNHTLCANAIRVLTIDAVQKARSGHPGMPMGMADCATVLWRHILSVNPSNPNWVNRDRFVLSNGHGSMLIYALLHLTGHDLSSKDISEFRQLHSSTPGHPEYGDTPGVETTTGPLGQGLANAVGMAIAQKQLAARFHRDEHTILDHHTYAFVGDGCLMEGISHEVCSLAGSLGLGRLIVLWDDNGISIDGDVSQWLGEDVPARFDAYGWQVIRDVDGHDPEHILKAFEAAKANTTQPTLIACQTRIGFGSPNKVGTVGVHGAPLGDEEIALTRDALNWPHDPFHVPDAVYNAFSLTAKGDALEKEWQARWDAYEKAYPELAAECLRCLNGTLPDDWDAICETLLHDAQRIDTPLATRQASKHCLNTLVNALPELMGGSADLSGPNCTWVDDSTAFDKKNASGNYIHYGVREFGMAGIMNGLALHGGIIPYGGTFLTFVDYMRNAVRLSALMKQRVIYVLTHDSIGLGEDGPTHQPVEHIGMLRLTPNLHVWRPADAVESAVAWTEAINYQGPTALLFTRQGVPPLHNTDTHTNDIKRGGYVYSDVENPKALLIATGSELHLAVKAQRTLQESGIATRVVSVPCMEVFLEQDQPYRDSVLPPRITARVAVEASATAPWYRWVGTHGEVIGVDSFGASAPAAQVFEHMGITVDAIINATQRVCASH